jgi:methyl-accepting chemotaxis protein
MPADYRNVTGMLTQWTTLPSRVRPSLGAARHWLRRRFVGRHGRLRHEVADQLPVLPVLADQLQQTAIHIEQAVVDTCANFQGMAMRAQESVTRATAAMGAGDTGHQEGPSLEALVATAQQTLEHLLQRSQRSAELSMEAATRVEAAEQAMRKIAETTTRVDAIAFGIKLLALNAKIEAVHVGQKGAGFGIVADEIARHAHDSTEVAEGIRSTVGELMQGIRETRETLTQLASADMHDVELSRREVQSALHVLTTTNAQMHASVAQAAESSRALAGDIAQAVTALQFQDRVNQRLAHVVTALGDVHSALQAASTDGAADAAAPATETAPSSQPAAAGSAALARLQAQYTMADEHQAHLKATGTDGAASDGGSVELF